jgi:creatinine amidohydrolase
LLIVPTGSCEQHGPHLSFTTDIAIAAAVARRVAERLADVDAVLAPEVPYGASGEHEGFPGTLSIGLNAFRVLVVELGRSARSWCGRLLVINGHGGNARALSDAMRLLRQEGSDAGYVTCATPGGDAHAGRSETSIQLALHPETVDLHSAVAGAVAPVEELLSRLQAEGVRAVSPSGVLGDPSGASADQGWRLLDALVDGTVTAVRRWSPSADGRLDGPAREERSRVTRAAAIRAP